MNIMETIVRNMELQLFENLYTHLMETTPPELHEAIADVIDEYLLDYDIDELLNDRDELEDEIKELIRVHGFE